MDATALLSGAARLGYTAVDLIDEMFWPLAREHGLRISAINGHLPGLNRRENAADIETEIRRNLAKAQQWDIPLLICFTGNRQGLDDDTGLAVCSETLAKLAPLEHSSVW